MIKIKAQAIQNGYWSISQDVFAYEVRMTSKKPEAQWRSNHVIMAVAKSPKEAMEMCLELYPDDPIIDQIILRNRNMDFLMNLDVAKEVKNGNG